MGNVSKASLNDFELIEETFQFSENFIKNYDEGYFLEADVQYSKKVHGLHNGSSFWSERKEIEKVQKLIANLWNKNEYVIHIRSLKQALNIGLILKKVYRVIKFSQKDWLKPYIKMKTELRQKAKYSFEKDFCKFMNNIVFGKTMENMRKHRVIKLVTTEKRRNYLVSEHQNYLIMTTRNFLQRMY